MRLSHLLLSMALVSLCTAAPGQPEARNAFEKMKALAGTWEGTISTSPPDPNAQGKSIQVTLRVTSSGNALLHEAKMTGQPDDPITMIYVDGDRLMLTHYCDAGNRPRMSGKAAVDGKSVAFDFVDLSGGTERGYMHDVTFTFLGPDHHIEDWIFMIEGKAMMRARFDLKRK